MSLDARDLQIRDPFVVVHDGRYHLFGSTDRDIWQGPGVGFDTYTSTDLRTWQGPTAAFRPPAGFWGQGNFWAPEVHRHGDGWYMFATFRSADGRRGSAVLRAERIKGPYLPWSDGPITPAGWQCLDATLYLDDAGRPWTVFCHEWQQVHDGGMWAMPLADDLRRPAGRPVWLFNASEAPWTRPLALPPEKARPFPVFVTDGPFLWRDASGDLLLIWSSFTDAGYAIGVARSASGLVTGPWVHEPEPLVEGGGHGMIVRDLAGDVCLVYHAPNSTPDERLQMRRLTSADAGGSRAASW